MISGFKVEFRVFKVELRVFKVQFRVFKVHFRFFKTRGKFEPGKGGVPFPIFIANSALRLQFHNTQFLHVLHERPMAFNEKRPNKRVACLKLIDYRFRTIKLWPSFISLINSIQQKRKVPFKRGGPQTYMHCIAGL